jgi:hypothetical protein
MVFSSTAPGKTASFAVKGTGIEIRMTYRQVIVLKAQRR